MTTLLASGPLLAQTGRITGTVTTAEGARPLAGAQISVAGASGGAVSGDDGRYTMNVPAGTYTVYATRIGYARDSVTGVVVSAGGTATADFHLQGLSLLQSVVVIGYGETQEKDRTGVVTAVTEKEFNTGRVVSPEQLIQAKVSGVQVVESNEPGGGIAVRIRGGTSINASNDPLYVVDGVPLAVGGGVSAGRNPLNFLNPGDIESITVLKDASATAIYGSRGANGVIIITTKSGRSGPQVSYTSTVSTSQVTGEPSLLSAAQYRTAMQQFAPENVNTLGNANTNWRDLVQHNGIGKENTLAFSARRQDMNYRLSLGYLDQSGVVLGTDLKRFSAGLNYDDQFFGDRLTVRGSLKGSRTDDRFTPGGVIGAATSFDPTQAVLTTAGNYYFYTNRLAPDNPVAQLNLISDRGISYRSVGDLEGRYRMPWVDGFTMTVRGGYDVANSDRTTFVPTTLGSQAGLTDPGSFAQTGRQQLSTVLDAFGNFKRGVDIFHGDLDLTAGYSYEQSRGDFPFFQATGLTTNVLGPNGIPGVTKPLNPTYFVDESRLISGFARANINIKDRYLLTGSVRRDGSSRFGPANRWGTFPSAAFAWRVVDESFMKAIPLFSDLKLRASWGVNGNQTIPNYQFVSRYEPGNNAAQAQFGNEFVSTIRPTAADPNIKWEETRSTNLGFDYGLFSNRLTGSVDFYTKKTNDLLFTVPVPNGSNLSDFVLTNIGSMRNRGFEFSLNAQVIDQGSRGFSWDASFNASTNTNRLLQINPFGGSSQQLLFGPFISGGVGSQVQVLVPGQPVGSFFVYRHKSVNGVPVKDRDASGKVVTPDTAMYVDINGDNKIDQNDRVPYKSAAPKWILGHTSTMGYRNVDVSFTMRAYLGNYVYNNVASSLGHYSALKGSTPVNLETSVLRYGFVDPQYFSDIYVEKASFLRMDNLTLGYTFRGLRSVQQLRLFGTVQNVFTVTPYGGVDPTAGLSGIDNNIYPRSRTYLAGATVGF